MEDKRETPIQRAARICDDTVNREARSAAEKLMQKTGDDFWAEFNGVRRASNLHSVEPIPAGNPSPKGGGSKSKNKKSKTGNKVYTQVWDDH